MVFLKLARKDFEVNEAVARDGNPGGGLGIKTAAREHRGMLDGRHITMPSAARLRRQRKRIRLGAAAGENHILGARCHEGGNLRTRLFVAFSEAPTRRLAAIVLRRQQGQFAIRARGRLDDDAQADTAFFEITDEPHVIEFELGRDGAPGAPATLPERSKPGSW